MWWHIELIFDERSPHLTFKIDLYGTPSNGVRQEDPAIPRFQCDPTSALLYPAPIVHPHAAMFSSWMLLVQKADLGQVLVGRNLGLAGFLLARVMDKHIISARTDFEVRPIFIWNAHSSPS